MMKIYLHAYSYTGPVFKCWYLYHADKQLRIRRACTGIQSHHRSCSSNMGLDATKPVFGVSDNARLKPVFTATETSLKIEISLVYLRYFLISE